MEETNLCSILEKREWKEKGKFTIPWTIACEQALKLLYCYGGLPLKLHFQMSPDHITHMISYHILPTILVCQDISSFKLSPLRSVISLLLEFDNNALVCPINLFPGRQSAHFSRFYSIKKKEREKSPSWCLFWICLCSILCVSLLCSVACVRWKAIILPEMYL